MKIGIYDPYLDALGGGEKYMLTAASCLSKDHHVSLFWDDRGIRDAIEKRFALDLTRVHFTKNIFSKDTPFFSRLILSKKFDVIFYLSDGSIPFVTSSNLLLHFQFPIEWVDTSTYLYRLKRSRISDIVVNSAFTKEYIDKKFSWDSKIVYPPVGVEKLNGKHKKEKMILTVGRYNPLPDGSDFKKHTFLISVFKSLVDKGLKGWELVVVVSYQERDKRFVDLMEEGAKDYPIQIKRNLSYSQLASIYKSASLYWHAAGFGEHLKKNPELAEHFGIATVEAMAAGVVPLVINAGGQKEIVRDNENGVVWDTKEELMRKTLHIINDPSLWKKYSEAAEKDSQQFSEQIFYQRIREIINAQ